MVRSSLHLHAFRLHRELVRKCNFDILLYFNKDVQTREKKNLVRYFRYVKYSYFYTYLFLPNGFTALVLTVRIVNPLSPSHYVKKNLLGSLFPNFNYFNSNIFSF